MKHYLTKEEFVNAIIGMNDNLSILLENEEGETSTMNLKVVDFNGGAILYDSPMSTETGILQDNIFGDVEHNAGELFDDLLQYLYRPYRKIIEDEGFLVIINHTEQNLFFVRLTEEDLFRLNNDHDGNIESWVSDTELEEKLHFNMSNCSYIFVGDEMPEMYGYDMKNKQEIRLSLFS